MYIMYLGIKTIDVLLLSGPLTCASLHFYYLLGYYINFGDEFGMATAVIGQVPEFNPEMDSLNGVRGASEALLQANGIEDACKVPVLLSVTGGKTYDLL